MNRDLQRSLAYARLLVRAAGTAVMGTYGGTRAGAAEDAWPGAAAQRAAGRIILRLLRAEYPAECILGEESGASAGRLRCRAVWVMDPLEVAGEPPPPGAELCVQLGMAADGEAVLGAVYLPEKDLLYSAALGLGAWVMQNGEQRRLRIHPRAGPPRLVADPGAAEPLLQPLQRALGATDALVCSSVGRSCALVAEGARDLYLHPVPQLREWETCAPEVIVREAGGSVTDCRGARLAYNKRVPVHPYGLLVCAPGVEAQVLPRLRPMYDAVHTLARGA